MNRVRAQRVVCTVEHLVDADDDGIERSATVGQTGRAIKENSNPEASDAYAIVWDGNDAWGFYSLPELLAVARFEEAKGER